MPKPRGSLAISRRPHQDATLGGMKRLRRLRLLAASIIARFMASKTEGFKAHLDQAQHQMQLHFQTDMEYSSGH